MKKNLFYILIIILLFFIVCALVGILISIHKDTTATTASCIPEATHTESPISQTTEVITPAEITIQPSSVIETNVIIEEQKTEEPQPEYKEFLKYGIKPKEAKYYEHE